MPKSFSIAVLVAACFLSPPSALASDTVVPASLEGRFLQKGEIKNYMDFRQDGTFTLFYRGTVYSGTYKVQGDRVSYAAPWIPHGQGGGHLSGDTISDDDHSVWQKQAESQAAAPQPTAAITAQQSQPPVPDGPAMKEIEDWAKRQLPSMGSDRIVESNGQLRFETKYGIEKAVISDCRFTLHRVSDIYSGANNDPLTKRIDITTVTLRDVDVSKILPRETVLATGYTASKASFRVPLIALPDRGAPFTLKFGLGDVKQVKSGFVQVADQSLAIEVATMLRRAAVLCGAPNQAVEAIAGSPVKTQDPTSGAPAAPKMTNSDIIAMVGAGLSIEVITKSIAMAVSKDFDVTPTGLIALKKSKVSDEVISAMQNNSTQTLSASSSGAKAPPKYDPSLAESPKAVSPQAVQNPCAGVELLGFYKNEIFDRAMGGGVVEWLAKIRNNTSVTKIVVFGWVDSNGQQQRAQVQIHGGDIASPRVDLTQSRYIAPVNDLRLLSCN